MAKVRASNASGGGGSAYDFHYEIVADANVTKTVDEPSTIMFL